MSWRGILLALAGLFISAALISFAQPIAEFLLSSFGIETVDRRPQVAEILKTKGGVFVRSGGRGAFKEVRSERPLFQRDEIKTEAGGRAHIRFRSGYEIEVLDESQAIFDIWSSKGPRRPEYISFLRGDYRLISKGTPGLVYIVLEDEVFAPEARPTRSKRNFKISTDTVVPRESQATLKTEPAGLPEVAKKPEMPDKLTTKESETLSSAYIESVLMSRAALFRRCQLTSVRDNKMAIGNLLFSMVIEPSGRVKNVKLLQKSLRNPTLESCVASVIERTKFKAFQGASISLSYPLNFQ